MAAGSRLSGILEKNTNEVLEEWLENQRTAMVSGRSLMKDAELRQQSREFLGLLTAAVRNNPTADASTVEWTAVREMLAGVSRSRALQGYTPTETATFVFSLKQPVFAR